MLTSPRRQSEDGEGKLSGCGMCLLWHPASTPPQQLHTRRELHGHSVALFVLTHLRSENLAILYYSQRDISNFALARKIQFPHYFQAYVNLVLKAVKLR